MARVPLLRQEDLPEDYQYLLSEDALGEPNVLRAIANNPPVLQSYMRYGTTLWEESGLSFRERELAILAIARTLRSRYEWHQHVAIAEDAGISTDEMAAIGRDDDAAFEGAEGALIAYARAFAEGGVTDDLHDALAVHYDDRTVAGTAMLASHYVATARAIDALDVPVEDAFVGWDPRAG